MSQTFLHLFNTPLGRCGIGWNETGIVSVSFPEASEEMTLERLRKNTKNAEDGKVVADHKVPDHIRQITQAVMRLMEGHSESLLEARLDLSGVGEFERAVYDLSRKIMPGETRTYGDLARDLGDIAFSQRIGQALGRNPVPIIVPCHRVVGADGKMTGFSAPGGVETKRKLLKIEGAIEPDLLDFL